MNGIELDYRVWLERVQSPDFGWQLLVLVLAGIGAWLVHRAIYVSLSQAPEGQAGRRLHEFTRKSLRRMLFPLSMLVGVFVGRAVLDSIDYPVVVLDIAVPLLLSLAAIRLLVYLLRKSFTPSPAVKAWESLVSTSIWILVALHLLGWLPYVLQAMDEFAFSLGATRISLLAVVKLVLLIALLWVIAFWLSALIERRMTSAAHVSPGLRVGVAKVSKVVLLTLALLVALDAVGIDLTALTVFGGALGVGIGFGLQRIASNFISGFIVLFDRSIKPGDVISVGDKFGWVQELRARYIVVRDRDGVETLIPNETLITTEVINWSYSDRDVRIKIPVSISYGDDPEQAMAIMLEAAHVSPRVKDEPAPVCRLMEFGDNGILLELRVWILDPENGVNGVRSDVNLDIWRRFKAAGITIPFPQRDVYIKSDVRGSGQGGVEPRMNTD
ncbi:MAG: mechanosensitive ion channel protein MscS [Gammaproteobacteria bacterium]|nr:mechanosensitive ion channel protein MscS [Gammaproteobacteria bacterium]